METGVYNAITLIFKIRLLVSCQDPGMSGVGIYDSTYIYTVLLSNLRWAEFI